MIKANKFRIPSLDSDMNESINLVFKTIRNNLTSTEQGYCQTSAKPFLFKEFLTFDVHEIIFLSLSV